MLVETTRVTEFEYYFACTRSVSLSCFCNLQTLYLFQILLGNFFSNFYAVCPLMEISLLYYQHVYRCNNDLQKYTISASVKNCEVK